MIVDKAYYNTKCKSWGLASAIIGMKTNRDSAQREKVKISNKWKPTKLQDYKFEGVSTDKWSLESPVTIQGKRTGFFGGSGATETVSENPRANTKNIPAKKKQKIRKSRKPDRYLVCDQELRTEEAQRVQKKKMNWRKRQQHKERL